MAEPGREVYEVPESLAARDSRRPALAAARVRRCQPCRAAGRGVGTRAKRLQTTTAARAALAAGTPSAGNQILGRARPSSDPRRPHVAASQGGRQAADPPCEHGVQVLIVRVLALDLAGSNFALPA